MSCCQIWIMKYLKKVMSRLRLMSDNNEVAELHMLIEKSQIPKEQQTELHQKLRNAGNDPNVINEIRETLAPTARDKSKEITDGDREPQHLGEHTLETLTQEVTSLGNIKPMFRNTEWMKRYDHIKNILEKDIKKNVRAHQGLLNKLNAIFQGEL